MANQFVENAGAMTGTANNGLKSFRTTKAFVTTAATLTITLPANVDIVQYVNFQALGADIGLHSDKSITSGTITVTRTTTAVSGMAIDAEIIFRDFSVTS